MNTSMILRFVLLLLGCSVCYGQPTSLWISDSSVRETTPRAEHKFILGISMDYSRSEDQTGVVGLSAMIGVRPVFATVGFDGYEAGSVMSYSHYEFYMFIPANFVEDSKPAKEVNRVYATMSVLLYSAKVNWICVGAGFESRSVVTRTEHDVKETSTGIPLFAGKYTRTARIEESTTESFDPTLVASAHLKFLSCFALGTEGGLNLSTGQLFGRLKLSVGFLP